jgi:hypothetical protein
VLDIVRPLSLCGYIVDSSHHRVALFFPLPLPIWSCGGAWQWFGPVLSFINRHDVRLWSYINCDWDAFPMWQVITHIMSCPSHVQPAVGPSSWEAPHNAPTPRLTPLPHRALSPSLCTLKQEQHAPGVAWGDSRVETHPALAKKWRDEVSECVSAMRDVCDDRGSCGADTPLVTDAVSPWS